MRRMLLAETAMVFSLLGLTSCGMAVRSGSYAPADAPMGRGSFAWAQAEDEVLGDRLLEGNRFFEDRLHEAIEFELSLRGINLVDSGSPDYRVHHHLTLADHELPIEVVDESGFSATETDLYKEGTVVVHLVRADTDQDVWVGWAQTSIEQAVRSPEAMRKWVYDLVGEMFEDWPVPARDFQD